MTSYVPKEVVLDSEGFAPSFSLGDNEAQAFFDEFGFVVFDRVLTEEDVTRTIDGIWSKIESFCGGKLGIHRDYPSSWTKRWPGGGPGLMGQALTTGSWNNRANPKLRQAFEAIIGRTDLVASVDNFGVLRPTRDVPMNGPLSPQHPCRIDVVVPDAMVGAATKATSGGVGGGVGGSVGESSPLKAVKMNQPGWRTASKWIHWDMSPFHWVDGTMLPFKWSPYTRVSENNGCKLDGNVKVQGLLNLIDARLQDGGFMCVPGFHKHLHEWVAMSANEQYKCDMAEAHDYLEVPEGDPLIECTQRVPMRKGSLLVWNSELPHCNYSNDSERFRMVQYVKCFPVPSAVAAGMSDRREQHTKEVLLALGEGAVEGLDDLQRAMLGLTDYQQVGA
jgi:hypothetical protein